MSCVSSWFSDEREEQLGQPAEAREFFRKIIEIRFFEITTEVDSQKFIRRYLR